MDAPALVGRREELALLDNAFERTRRGRSHIVLVTGDPGVGKTRLLAELAARHGRRALVLTGRGSPLAASIPFATVAEAIENHLRTFAPADLAALVGERAADLAATLPSVASGSTATGSSGRLATLEALARLLVSLAAGRQVLLVLDDVHQSDPSTWELVSYLGRNPLHSLVLLVAALRQHEVTFRPDLERLVLTLTNDGLADVVHLRPPEAEDIGALAEQALGPAVVDAELRSWLVDRTRGNSTRWRYSRSSAMTPPDGWSRSASRSACGWRPRPCLLGRPKRSSTPRPSVIRSRCTSWRSPSPRARGRR